MYVYCMLVILGAEMIIGFSITTCEEFNFFWLKIIFFRDTNVHVNNIVLNHSVSVYF